MSTVSSLFKTRLLPLGRGRISATAPFERTLSLHRPQYEPGSKTLVVAFDNAEGPLKDPFEGRKTWGGKFYSSEGHSVLGVIAKTTDWYRNAELIETFGRLRPFLSRFENVILTGGPMGGFAALAFAPLFPDCTVIAISPQSSLCPNIVPWEKRHLSMSSFKLGRSQDWTLPYSDSVTSIKFAKKIYILYDSLDTMDRLHVERMRNSKNVTILRLPAGGHGASPMLVAMGAHKDLTRRMIAGDLTAEEFQKLARKRRDNALYYELLGKHAMARKKYARAEWILRKGLERFYSTRLLDALNDALSALGKSSEKADVPQQKPQKDKDQPMSEPQSHRFDASFPNLKRNIFVVTYGRTGSTLLQNIMMTIPGCIMRGENHNMIESIWHAAIRCRMAKSVWGQVEQPQGHPWFGADEMRPMQFSRGMIDSFVNNVLCPPRDCRYFGFKEIRYNVFDDRLGEVLDFMRFHFKDAFFVFNTRNVADVSKSAWWADWQADDVGGLVANMDRRFAEYHAAHPEFTEVVCYDEYTEDPEKLRPLFEKLGEPFDRAKLDLVLGTRLTH